MKNKRSSEEGSQKVEHRAKRKSSTETVAPVECVFCGEKERDLSKMSKKQKLRKQGNTTQVFRVLMCSMSSLSNRAMERNGFSIRKYRNTFEASY